MRSHFSLTVLRNHKHERVAWSTLYKERCFLLICWLIRKLNAFCGIKLLGGVVQNELNLGTVLARSYFGMQ